MDTIETHNFTSGPTITNRETLQPICNTPLSDDNTETNIGIRLIFPKDVDSYNQELSENNGNYITIKFDENSYISGFKGTIQNCLVDTLTVKGSDTNHPTRGTDLENDAIEGYINSNNTLMHSCNFASEEVKNFQNNYLSTNYTTRYKTTDNTAVQNSGQTKIWSPEAPKLVSPTIESYRLTPQFFKLDVATLQAQFVSSEGESIGLAYDTSLLDGVQ